LRHEEARAAPGSKFKPRKIKTYETFLKNEPKFQRPIVLPMGASRTINRVRDNVLRYIRERRLMGAGDRVAVAVSGGADSVALLRVLLDLRTDLGIVLAVAHFNHGLRGAQSQADEAFVAELAKELTLEFFVGRGDVRDHALTRKLSLEAAGRKLRYRWLAQLSAEQRFDAVATAHTLDDQAETVLLKFLRGAGTRGLAGIYPVLEFGNTRVIRPLLNISRAEVEAYLESLGQQWREDETNLDRRFTRNRVRHDLLPLLEREFNPNIRGLLSDAAELSRAEEDYWQALVERELAQRLDPVQDARAKLDSDAKDQAEGDRNSQAESGTNAGAQLQLDPNAGTRVQLDPNAGARVERRFSAASPPVSFYSKPASAGGTFSSGRLLLDGLPALPLALQRRLLRAFADKCSLALDFEHVEKLLHCALGERSKAELPSGWIAERQGTYLQLQAIEPAPVSSPDYEYMLPVPGEVRLTELHLTVRALIVAAQFAHEMPAATLLNEVLIGPQLTIRNWRPGDRFWPAHSRSEEKLKRLFAEKRIPADQRLTWPVILHRAEIVWVRSFPVAGKYEWKGAGDAVKIDILQN
jgi:tRNA(Ile)-lysidine synthase